MCSTTSSKRWIASISRRDRGEPGDPVMTWDKALSLHCRTGWFTIRFLGPMVSSSNIGFRSGEGFRVRGDSVLLVEWYNKSIPE
jgi:hypothetical protein